MGILSFLCLDGNEKYGMKTVTFVAKMNSELVGFQGFFDFGLDHPLSQECDRKTGLYVGMCSRKMPAAEVRTGEEGGGGCRCTP